MNSEPTTPYEMRRKWIHWWDDPPSDVQYDVIQNVLKADRRKMETFQIQRANEEITSHHHNKRYMHQKYPRERRELRYGRRTPGRDAVVLPLLRVGSFHPVGGGTTNITTTISTLPAAKATTTTTNTRVQQQQQQSTISIIHHHHQNDNDHDDDNHQTKVHVTTGRIDIPNYDTHDRRRLFDTTTPVSTA